MTPFRRTTAFLLLFAGLVLFSAACSAPNSPITQVVPTESPVPAFENLGITAASIVEHYKPQGFVIERRPPIKGQDRMYLKHPDDERLHIELIGPADDLKTVGIVTTLYEFESRADESDLHWKRIIELLGVIAPEWGDLESNLTELKQSAYEARDIGYENFDKKFPLGENKNLTASFRLSEEGAVISIGVGTYGWSADANPSQ